MASDDNRWDAFTDEEIDLFGNAVQQWPFVARENRQIARTIESEIDAELERRRTPHGPYPAPQNGRMVWISYELYNDLDGLIKGMESTGEWPMGVAALEAFVFAWRTAKSPLSLDEHEQRMDG